CYFEFSAMQGINAESTLPKLMQKYLDFFDIKRDAIGVEEHGNTNSKGRITVYPNPASEKVLLSFFKTGNSSAEITIFDINGKKVAILHDESQLINSIHFTQWDLNNMSGQKVPSGLYIGKVVDESEVRTIKIIVK
ncbi:MAG: T9SS type A sorting domain-containing protein, partial [Bacteroidales bacterium]